MSAASVQPLRLKLLIWMDKFVFSLIFTFARWLKTLPVNISPHEYWQTLLICTDLRLANSRLALMRRAVSNGVFVGWCPRILQWWRALRKSSLKHNSPDEASSAAVALAKVQPYFIFFFSDGFPLWGLWCYACRPPCWFIYDTIYLDFVVMLLQATRCESAILFLSYLLDIIACHWEFEINAVNLASLHQRNSHRDHFKSNSRMHCCVSSLWMT